jgi:hypothetical protein
MECLDCPRSTNFLFVQGFGVKNIFPPVYKPNLLITPACSGAPCPPGKRKPLQGGSTKPHLHIPTFPQLRMPTNPHPNTASFMDQIFPISGLIFVLIILKFLFNLSRWASWRGVGSLTNHLYSEHFPWYIWFVSFHERFWSGQRHYPGAP